MAIIVNRTSLISFVRSMDLRWILKKISVGAWFLTAAGVLIASLTVAPVVGDRAHALSKLRAVCNNQLMRCKWPVGGRFYGRMVSLSDVAHGQNGRRRQLYQWSRQSPFAAGWKRWYAGRTGSGRGTTSGTDSQNGPHRLFTGDNKRTRYSFSSWGGKRSPMSQPPIDYVALEANQQPATFSSWTGKRSQQFFSWGGKRSLTADELEWMATATTPGTVDSLTRVGYYDEDEWQMIDPVNNQIPSRP